MRLVGGGHVIDHCLERVTVCHRDLTVAQRIKILSDVTENSNMDRGVGIGDRVEAQAVQWVSERNQQILA